MLFHVGALWRLNDAGWLPRLDRISAVSGGSITAGRLATVWNDLTFVDGHATNLQQQVVDPLRAFARKRIDVPATLLGLLLPGDVSRWVARRYASLFNDISLDQLPEHPFFVFNATSLQSGVLWRFDRDGMGDWRVGRVLKPHLALARAVAASSAFPPFLSPSHLRFADDEMQQEDGNEIHVAPYTQQAVLSDGGVYDNLGLEHPWKRCRTILISDGGGHISDSGHPRALWPIQVMRVMKVIDNQVRDLRKRQAIGAFDLDERDGSYWGIRSNIAKYHAPDKLPCPADATRALAEVSTRLWHTDATTQKRVINWGYAITDAALRSWVDTTVPPPSAFPYPDSGVG